MVSAFRLSGPELVNWPGWDGLFNACLLRRPPRQFFYDHEEQLQIKWHDDKAHPNPLDARLNSRLRFFSRDTGVTFSSYAADLVPSTANEPVNVQIILAHFYWLIELPRRSAAGHRPGGLERFQPGCQGRPTEPATGSRHQGAQSHVRGLDCGWLCVGAGAGQLVCLPPAGPGGMGLGRRPADRRYLHDYRHSHGAVGHRLCPRGKRDRCG